MAERRRGTGRNAWRGGLVAAAFALFLAPASHSFEPPSRIGEAVHERLRKDESAAVVVMLDPAATGAIAPGDREKGIARAQDLVLEDLADTEWTPRRRYRAVPALAGEVGLRALERLARHPFVLRVDLDEGGSGSLLQAVPLTNVDDVQALGVDGSGITVAVLDSGIDGDHPDLVGALQAEACFCFDNGAGCCPDGSTTQFGPGAAADDHGHGSNVTGIVTSDGIIAPRGTAPGADIVSVKVLDEFNAFCCVSDIVAALDWLLTDRPDVDVVNMSLGTWAMYAGDCDGATSFTLAMASAINSLRARGTTCFVSSGNTASTTQMQAPACIASALSVAAVWDSDVGRQTVLGCTDATTAADRVTCFSNRNAQTDLFAPGAPITSCSRSGATSTFFGTSQASPHVAGCAADLLAAFPGLTPDALEAVLEDTAVLVPDPITSLVHRRIDCLAAYTALACEDRDADGAFASASCPTGPVDCDDSDAERRPGLDETCDGKDNDCDGVVPPAELAVPGLVGGLRVTRASITFTPASDAASHDVVSGDLFLLRSSADPGASVVRCEGEDIPGASGPLPSALPPAAWLLVRGTSCAARAGSFDSGGASQRGSRDASIAASALSCR